MRLVWPVETSSRFVVPPDPTLDVAGRWVAVGTLDDLWEGEMVGLLVGDIPVVVLNVDGDVVAYEDRCPHLGSPLSEGRFDDGILTCLVHEWTFNGCDGQGINATVCLRRFAVRVDDERISVNTGLVLQEERVMPGIGITP
jgi:toluene monooxygenase system ferredoxin subunit